MTGGKENPKILIKAVNWVGDAVLMTPAVRGLRKKFPGSHIAVLVKPRVKDVFRENNDINEIIVYGGRDDSPITGKLKLIREIRRKKFDLGIAVQPRSYEAAFILFLGGVRERIGYSHFLRNLLLTKTVKLSKEAKHDVDVFSGVLEPLGVVLDEKKPVLNTDSVSEEWADKFLKENRIERNDILVGLNPGSYSQARRWPEDRYAKLADEIIRGFNAKVLVFSGPGDDGVVSNVCSAAREDLIVGRTDLLQLAALCRKCRVVVSNDTGPAHIASAVGTPVITISGATDPVRTGPYGEGNIAINKSLSCSPCFLEECGDLKCMKEVTVDEVLEAVKGKIKK